MSDLSERLAGLSPAQRQLLEQRLAAKQAQQPKTLPPAGGGADRDHRHGLPVSGGAESGCVLAADPRGSQRGGEVPAERWDPDEFYDPTGETAGARCRCGGRRWSMGRATSIRSSLESRRARRRGWTRSSGCSWKWRGRRWRTPAGRPTKWPGTKTGVFVGIGATDYSKIAVPYDDYYERIDAHMGTGNALSIAANRVSYIFDFHGPSAAVDTACSSSSLAIHFAVESLRRGESDAALAGGVNMILTPETTIAFSKARMLSPEGKCRPFDAGANGYVRGEGCGLVLLKRLADAERDGDNILAVLRATSVNQDGRTSGISAPNSQSQIAVHPRGAEAGGADAGRRELHRSAWHGHAAGRPDRDAGAGRDFPHERRDCAAGAMCRA